MRHRHVLVAALVGVTAAGSLAPAMAAKPKPKPKPITGTFTATANPDPTSNQNTTMLGSYTCQSTLPTSRVTHTFVVPAAGTLEVKANNKLDWSLDVREGAEELAGSDGGTPTDPEAVFVAFKKKTTVTIGVCNFAGEPTINPSYVFTYK